MCSTKERLIRVAITIFVEKTGKTITKDVKEFKTVKDIILYMNENISGIIVSVNSQIVLEEYEIQDGDAIALLSVVSGG